MANRYWVGSSGTWLNTGNWSTTDGGSGGASAPTENDDIFFTENSAATAGLYNVEASDGAGVVNVKCRNLTVSSSTKFPWIYMAGTYILEIHGSMLLNSGMQLGSGSGTVYFYGSSSGRSITINGAQLAIQIRIALSGGDISLGGHYIPTIPSTPVNAANYFSVYSGTFNTNNYNMQVKAALNFTDTSGVSSVTLGTSNLRATQIGVTGANLTFSGASATFQLEKDYSLIALLLTLTKTGVSIGTVNINGTTDCTIVGNSTGATIGTFYIAPATRTINFSTASNWLFNITNFNVTSSVGNVITLTSPGSGKYIFSKPSGTVSCDYLNIKNSTATGGATWNAGANSINSGNNLGWFFPGEVKPSAPFFGAAF